MHKTFATLGKSVAAAAIIAGSVGAATPTFARASVIQQQATTRRAERERHPEIRNAINALERAKTDLKRANHDFGGHRADALEACDRAIAQLKLALQYDRK